MAYVTPRQFADAHGFVLDTVYSAMRGRLAGCYKSNGARGYLIDNEKALAAWKGVELAAEEVKAETSLPPEIENYVEIPDIDESLAREKHWKAELAELVFHERSGKLVPATEVEGAYANEVAICRVKLLAVPNRFRQRVTMTDKEYDLLQSLQREALEELGRSGGLENEQ